jgi:hypothetical protein
MPYVPRCKEIIGWLERHSEVNRFAVMDDEDDWLDELPLFQPSARTGLTDEIVNGVRDYLNGRTDRDMRCGRVYADFSKYMGNAQAAPRIRVAGKTWSTMVACERKTSFPRRAASNDEPHLPSPGSSNALHPTQNCKSWSGDGAVRNAVGICAARSPAT